MNDLFPIDFEALSKGEFIRQEKIEQIYRIRFREDPTGYRFAQMRLISEIRARRHDLSAHVKSSNNDIEILDDLKADEHTHRQIQQAQCKIVSFNERRGVIDRTGFSAAELATANSRDRIGQAAMIGMRTAIEKAKRDELLLQQRDDKSLL